MSASPLTPAIEADAIRLLSRAAAPIPVVLLSLGLRADWIAAELAAVTRDRQQRPGLLGEWCRARLARWERLEAAQARGVLASLARGRVAQVRLALGETTRRPTPAQAHVEEPPVPTEDRAESLRRRGFVA